MTLRLEDKWVWDFWFARDQDQHHIFYLQAPRALGDPERRHRNATIGHAVSTDLEHWRVLPDALHPGAPGSWDDIATWTGSVIEHDGRWHMLYTGISSADDGLVQRVGLATSDDLIHWQKHPGNPVLESDPRWYESLDLTRWRDQSWRDPWLFRTGDDDFVHALLTTRSPAGPADGAGVVAHARSMDLVDWEVLPPITDPGEFAQVEAPQLVAAADGSYVILISCLEEDHSRERLSRPGVRAQVGTYLFSGDRMFGPYAAALEPLASTDSTGTTLYAGKLVEAAPGDWRFLAFRGDHGSEFYGEIIDPMRARYEKQAGFVLEAGSAISPGQAPGLAPEVQALIDWDYALARRYAGVELPELRVKIRDELNLMLEQIGTAVEAVASTTDHLVAVDGGEIRVRIFSPGGGDPRPAFMHVHGGGFVLGTIDSLVNDAKCAHICRETGCVVATVEYRLAPERRFPTAAEDCYAALQFVADNADMLGVDAERIAVGGESAGGNLAAAVALMARDRGGPQIALQLLEVPVVDVSPNALAMQLSAAEFATGFGLDRSVMDRFARDYLGDEHDGSDPYASPLLAADLAGLPPAHVMTAEYDILRDGAEAYAARLEQAGVPVTLMRAPGQTHGSPVLWPSWGPAADWMAAVVDAITRNLSREREEAA